MTILQAIVLGLVQGVTEFLPISSSAHLILVSKAMGWPDQGLHFDMAANTGSLVAVMIYLRHDLASLLGGLLDLGRGRASGRGRLCAQILVATVPVGLAGLLLQDFVAGEGRSLWLLGTTSVVFGLLLAWADRFAAPEAEGDGSWSWRKAMGVGLAQALAILPGTSRSGVTMTAGLLAGMSRAQVARFSFLLAVPVGLIVAAKDVWDLTSADGVEALDWPPLLIGMVVSALAAWVAIDWLLKWLERRDFKAFAIYRVALGVLLLAIATF